MKARQAEVTRITTAQAWWQSFAGLFLAAALLKFPNPPLFEHFATPPSSLSEVIFGTGWPVAWAYGYLVILVLAGAWVGNWRGRSLNWILYIPSAWLLWQLAALAGSINPSVSWATWKHFAGCLACFYLGYFALGPTPNANRCWTFLVVALVLNILVAWEQHFGGLESSRKYFLTYVYPTMTEVAPEYLKKLTSTRVFGTLFYPNALAGALLLLMPLALTLIWRSTKATPAAKGLLVGLLAIGAAGALFWSGSKGGWLLMVLLLVLALLRWPLRSLKEFTGREWTLVALVLVTGLGVFFWKYSGFFRRGATSVVARFDYWRAGAHIALENPLTGTGPGTFGKAYAEVKRPESEMTRLAHNDYLQQASDSGFPGAIAYVLLWGAGLVLAARRLTDSGDLVRYAVWLGLLGWALQGMMEFGLYLPGLAWTAFFFLGWLLSRPAVPAKPA